MTRKAYSTSTKALGDRLVPWLPRKDHWRIRPSCHPSVTVCSSTDGSCHRCVGPVFDGMPISVRCHARPRTTCSRFGETLVVASSIGPPITRGRSLGAGLRLRSRCIDTAGYVVTGLRLHSARQLSVRSDSRAAGARGGLRASAPWHWRRGGFSLAFLWDQNGAAGHECVGDLCAPAIRPALTL